MILSIHQFFIDYQKVFYVIIGLVSIQIASRYIIAEPRYVDMHGIVWNGWTSNSGFITVRYDKKKKTKHKYMKDGKWHKLSNEEAERIYNERQDGHSHPVLNL